MTGSSGSQADDALAEIHKTRMYNKTVTMTDDIYRKQEEEHRRKTRRFKNIFYLVVLVVTVLPFIAVYLTYFLQNTFAK